MEVEPAYQQLPLPQEPVSKTRMTMALLQDPDCRAALAAYYRTGVNATLSVADAFSLPGEVVSSIGDILKLVRGTVRKFGFDPKFLDLTPDVSIWIAGPTELLEIPTGAHAPTHLIESSIQFWKYDRHRMRRGREAYKTIKSLTTIEQLRAYQESKKPKKLVPLLSDLSAQEILKLVPQPLI